MFRHAPAFADMLGLNRRISSLPLERIVLRELEYIQLGP